MAKRIIITTISLIILSNLHSPVMAQDDKLIKEVQVVRPYEPSISDAFKLNLLPVVEDTIRVVPTFSYNLALRPVTIDFPIALISPARMIAEPLGKVYLGYVRAGYGNYNSPMGELYLANKRSNKYSYGANIKYNSSFSDIKLDNEKMADGSFQRLNASAFGKRIFKKSELIGEAYFSRFLYGFYGYDTVITNIMPIDYVREEQAQQNIKVGIGYHSTHSDSTHLNYRFNSSFKNFADNFSVQLNTFNLQSSFDRYFKIEKFGGNVEFTHHTYNHNLSSNSSTIIRVSPWVGLFSKQWRVQAGMSVTFDINHLGTQSHFYPIALLSYDIISNYVIPYFQFSGYLEDNNYSKILVQNPWIKPGLSVWNTSHKFIIKGGLKGNLSPRVAYNLNASFSLVDSAYFFVNTIEQGKTYLSNKLDVVYDNIQHKYFGGELTVAPTRNIKLFFQAEYNIYTMQELLHPWHKPNYTGRVAVNYNIKDKILFSATFFIEGNRKVPAFNGDPIEIGGLMDLNLGFEYRLNKRMSAFINFNNITANRYHLWYLYPTQQFNMRGGITFSF